MTLLSAQKTSYVGQTVPLAAEYHESDFEWHEHAACASQVLMRQEEEAASLCSTSGRLAAPLMAAVVAAAAAPLEEGDKWETFYQQHSEAKFYKVGSQCFKLATFSLLGSLLSDTSLVA